jgi:RNA polymerase sigma factor (sigma-70 family)
MAGKKDTILIEGIKRQDEKIIAQIYNTYFPSIRQFIFLNNGTNEDARDIFNDAIVIILLKARENELSIKCSLKTFIYAICKNLWLKKIKSESINLVPYNEVEDLLSTSQLAEGDLINFDRGQLLFQKHLLRLPPTCREILSAFLEGKSFKEITEEMDFENESYARKRKYRCVKMLIKRIHSDPDYKTVFNDD